MSKHHTHTQCRVMHDIEIMSVEELEQQYDIQVDDDGTVWDNCEGRGFDDLQSWGLFIEELEAISDYDEEPYIKTGGKRRYEDD